MLKILTVNEIDSGQWAVLAEKSNGSSFFQTEECYRFYCSLSFMEPFLLGVSEENELKGIVCGYIIANGGKTKRFFSRRAIIPGGALLADSISSEALNLLLTETVKKLSKKAIYIEFRNYTNFSKYKTLFQENGFNYQLYLNYKINTQNSDFKKNFSESKIRQIRTGIKEGVQCVKTKSSDDIHLFYDILSKHYKEKVKKPLFPFEFFEQLVNTPNGHLFVIKYKNKVIGGMACVSLEKKILYEWFVCGDNLNFNYLYPSVFITNSVLDFAFEEGFHTFDFMGAGKPDVSSGVREFKSKFGGTLVEDGRFLYICNKFLYNIGKKAISLGLN